MLYPLLMPIFEYTCNSCHERVELLVSKSTTVECPKCSSRDLTKLLSTFSVGKGASSGPARPPVAPCGSCGDPRGPGSCRSD